MSLPDAAKAAIDGVKSNPSCLAALLITAMFLFINWYEMTSWNDQMSKRLEAAMQLLNRCQTLKPET